MTLICGLCHRVFWVAFLSHATARRCETCGRQIVGNCVTGARPGDTLRATVAEREAAA